MDIAQPCYSIIWVYAIAVAVGVMGSWALEALLNWTANVLDKLEGGEDE